MEKLLFAFLIGGIISVAAQLLIDLTRLTPARILVFYVCLGVFLGGIGLYEPVFDFSGAGISVPIIGFGGSETCQIYKKLSGDGDDASD